VSDFDKHLNKLKKGYTPMEFKKIDDVVVIYLKDRLNATNSPELQNGIIPMINKDVNKFILNMQELEYISSSGLRLIVLMIKKLKSHAGNLILTNLHPFVENIIDMTGFTQMLKIANSEEEALDILKE